MFSLFKGWYQRKFSDPEAVALVFLLVVGFLVLYFMGHLLAPFLVAVILAYLLDWPITRLEKFGMGRRWATSVVLLAFGILVVVAVVRILPTVWTQGANLITELPTMFNKAQDFMDSLPQRYPDLIDPAFVDTVTSTIQHRFLGMGEKMVQASISSLISLAALAIYCILVPLMLFFLLADKHRLIRSASRFLPKNRILVGQVWHEMHQQITNYLRGKAIEIIVVGIATYLVFFVMGMRYSALLGVAVGLSVLIPYIGAFVVTVPVTMVALFQWGPTADFGYLMLAYLIVQGLDGNLLVPLLFSEAVNLHPLAIIIAVILFGGLWGFWGVFFAIPLATLVKAVLNAWPSDTANTDKKLIE
ncbi:AI-2E family transporter [Celerinatantimonas sp. MCCC 1A17872]|uniref:AI-2E family transporter n=1 Tax=Celerinatantimonas sp. MCCC 1A17872 TaxID=3177514 RepID=UPI0038C6DC40